MGNSIYTSPSTCRFSIQLDHEDYPEVRQTIVAGHFLSGKVTVRVYKSLPPTQLDLRLTGKERSIIHIQRKHSHTERAERPICKAVTTLQQISTPTTPGTYIFPFSFEIPAAVPSSMYMSTGRSSCEIDYKLKLDATAGGTRSTAVRAISQRQFSVASRPLPNTQVPASMAPRLIPVQSALGLVQRGSIAIAARVLDVHVGRGTELEIFLACQNQASASIYRVELSVIETVAWHAKDALKRVTTRTIAELPNVDLPGVLRGKQDKKERRRLEADYTSECLPSLHQELQSARNRVTLPIPMGCRDTHQGFLIRVSHSLKITTHTKGGVSNPSVSIPLQIGFRPAVVGIERQFSPSFASHFDHHAVTLQSATAPHVTRTSQEAIAVPTCQASSVQSYNESGQGRPTAGYGLTAPVPMVEAVAIPMDGSVVIQAPMASAPSEAMVLGGMAVYATAVEDEDTPGGMATAATETAFDSSILPPAFPVDSSSATPPSMDVLLQEMLCSIDDYDTIASKIQASNEWCTLFINMTPSDLGSILAHVHRDTDQPRIAELLARECLRQRFTCAFGQAVVQNTAEWNRATMVQRILPCCVDVPRNYRLIQDELSDWDRAITESTFDQWTSASC